MTDLNPEVVQTVLKQTAGIIRFIGGISFSPNNNNRHNNNMWHETNVEKNA